MPRRRTRIATVENVARELTGLPTLRPAPQLVSVSSTRTFRWRTEGRTDTVIPGVARAFGIPPGELITALPTERQVAEFGVVLSSALAGGWIAEVTLHDVGYIAIGLTAGAYAGVRIWKEWTGG